MNATNEIIIFALKLVQLLGQEIYRFSSAYVKIMMMLLADLTLAPLKKSWKEVILQIMCFTGKLLKATLHTQGI